LADQKIVSKGSNVFYTSGFNEGGWDIQRFHTNNCQVVTKNFSYAGTIYDAAHYPLDMTLSNNVLHVLYTNKEIGSWFVAQFDSDTTALISTNSSFPAPPGPTNGTLARIFHK
jgi:hypothetical protein